MRVYTVQDYYGNIMGIYEDLPDAEDRLEELTDDGLEDLFINDYLLNADVTLYDATNVVEFKQ